MIDRVLILSASAGSGHLRAADAVAEALRDSNLAGDVRHVDALEYASAAYRSIYRRAYLEMVNTAPNMLGWLYDAADRPWSNEKRRLTFDRMNVRALIKLVDDYRPDYVVCTHFLPAEIISWLICAGRISSRHAVVVTDFDVHASWLCHHYTRYFVGIEEARQHLGRLGFTPACTIVSGIPISPAFAVRRDRQAMRARLGLDAGSATVLISAGGFGVGPMESLIANLKPARHELQVVAICGRNAELKERVDSLAAELSGGTLRVVPVGYADNMEEYMAAADLVLGKPGGLTTAEALASGLGFVIVNPIPGQEERNADHLLEQGAAIRCNNLPALAYKLDTLLDTPERLRAMQANALSLSRPYAAATIAACLADPCGDGELPASDSGHRCPDARPVLRRLRLRVRPRRRRA